jgi:hypothetical protein
MSMKIIKYFHTKGLFCVLCFGHLDLFSISNLGFSIYIIFRILSLVNK